MKMLFQRMAVSVVTTFAIGAAKAADYNSNEIPKIVPHSMLRTARAPYTYFLLGKASDGKTYVVVKNDRGIRIPKLILNSEYSDAVGDVDLYFESGERLVASRSSRQQGTLYSPQNGPKDLVSESNLQMDRLAELGIAPLLRPVDAKVKSEEKREAPFNMNGREVIIQVLGLSDEARLQFSDSRSLRQLGEGFKSTEAVVLSTSMAGLNLFGENRVAFLVKEEHADRLEIALNKLGDGKAHVVDFKLIQQMVEEGVKDSRKTTQSALNFVSRAPAIKVPLETMVASVVRLSSEPASFWILLKKSKSQVEVESIIKGLAYTLKVLHSLHLGLQYEFQKEVRLQTGLENYRAVVSETVKNPLYARMSGSIEKAAGAILTSLDRINHPAAQQLILYAANSFSGVGHRMYVQKATGSDRTYLQIYFDYLRNSESAAIDHILNRDFLNRAGNWVRITGTNGGNFQTLPGLSSDLVGGVDDRGLRLRYGNEWIQSPMINLGRPDRRHEMIESVLQTIIELDKKAEFFAQWRKMEAELYNVQRFGLNREAGIELLTTGFLSKETIGRLQPRILKAFGGVVNDETVRSINETLREELWGEQRQAAERVIYGHMHLFSLIFDLATTRNSDGYTFPGYSDIVYQKSVVEIFTKLLESAKISIINEGTYVTALDAAIRLGRELESSPEKMDGELRAAVRKMNAVIQAQLLTTFSPAKIPEAINSKAVPKYEFKMLRPVIYTCAHMFARN